MNPYSPPSPVAPYATPPVGGYGGSTGEGAMVTEATVEMLRQTRPWVMFLSVMSFIGSGLMLLGAISMIALGAFIPSNGPIPGAALGAVYLPFAFLYVYPAIKLWSFGGAIARLVGTRSSADLENALAQQKSFWKYAGIVAIVMIALYGVLIVGMGIVGVMAASKH